MKKRVVVTGMGAVSSIGLNVTENHFSLQHGKSGIGKTRYFQSFYTESMPFAEIPLSDHELRENLKINGQPELTRTTLIAMQAFEEAIQNAGLTQAELSSVDTGFISSSTVGGMCYTDQLYADANMKAKPSDFVRSYEGSDHVLRIVKHYKLTGFTDTINTACSSSANAIMLGAMLVSSGRLKRVIVGGADCLAKYTVNGFNSLMILSPDLCKPFDSGRNGLNLGEGAGYLVLEAEEFATGKINYAYVSGYGNSNDAFHPSTTSEQALGPQLAMKRALRSAGLVSGDIDYINAHGTGTENNDQTESFAFSQLFEQVPPYNSTKSYTGHTLAASGSLEAIYAILSLIHNELYTSLRCNEPISAFAFEPINQYISDYMMKHVMSNSFGFGGNSTALIFSKCS